MGKKKRGEEVEPGSPGLLDRIMSNRPLSIAIGAVIVAAFAGLGILVVTLLGGDELSQSEAALRPTAPIGPPVYERSAIADLFGEKSWDDMTDAERTSVKDEIFRVFDNSTFRAGNANILAIDVSRSDGDTLVSRQYFPIDTPGGDKAMAETMYFHCLSPEGTRTTHRYVVSPLQSDHSADIDEGITQPAWDAILEGADWSSPVDLGFKTSERTGRKLHGLEMKFSLVAEEIEQGRATQYWFDAETAQLAERGSLFPDDQLNTEANWYYLSYDKLPPIILPDNLEQPTCVQDLRARSGF